MKNEGNLIEPTGSGLSCPEAHFFIDPWCPVKKAVITHAHSDHARPGCVSYLATPECACLLKARLGPDITVQELSYGEGLNLDGVRLSLHPAGHILGPAQVRLERNGEVWVVTGDFKRHPDPTCKPFEPLRCHNLVTESTFGLPVFTWPDPLQVVADINSWRRKNKDQGMTSVGVSQKLVTRALARSRKEARLRGVEGLMLKRLSSPYGIGRRRGDWWKWKVDPLSVDAVLTYAQRGHGKRSGLYTDYTFSVWDGDRLVPFAKAYSGLTDAEVREVDRFIRGHTLERFGPVRSVKPELVFEIAFEDIRRSARHRSGVAVRFPRISRWRTDKTIAEADRLETIAGLIFGGTQSKKADVG